MPDYVQDNEPLTIYDFANEYGLPLQYVLQAW
jgi:hypothetical protein